MKHCQARTDVILLVKPEPVDTGYVPLSGVTALEISFTGSFVAPGFEFSASDGAAMPFSKAGVLVDIL